MVKVYIDPGHGGTDPGASGNGIQEKNIVLQIGLQMRDYLLNGYNGVSVRMSRANDTYPSLDERTDDANSWGADAFVSIHVNSFNGTAQGYEDFIHTSLSDSSSTARFRSILHNEIMKVNGLNNRGMKKADFHVLRETAMSSVLTENGFIDHPSDAAKMKQSSWINAVAKAHAEGVAKYFNLSPKANNQYIVTGGLGNAPIVTAATYMTQNQIAGDIIFDGSGNNPKLNTDVLTSGELDAMMEWLDEQGWYYTVRTETNPISANSLSGKYILTGGLVNNLLRTAADYMRENRLEGAFNFDGQGNNPKLKTNELTTSELNNITSWLDGLGWYYSVRNI